MKKTILLATLSAISSLNLAQEKKDSLRVYKNEIGTTLFKTTTLNAIPLPDLQSFNVFYKRQLTKHIFGRVGGDFRPLLYNQFSSPKLHGYDFSSNIGLEYRWRFKRMDFYTGVDLVYKNFQSSWSYYENLSLNHFIGANFKLTKRLHLNAELQTPLRFNLYRKTNLSYYESINYSPYHFQPTFKASLIYKF